MPGCNKKHKTMYKRGLIWQAPGKSKLFDNAIDKGDNYSFVYSGKNKSICNPLCFGTLKFVYETCKKNIDCTKKYVNKNLYSFLKTNTKNFHINKAYAMHNIKTLLFYGLLVEIKLGPKNFKYILSLEGRNFFELLNQKKYEDAVRFFLLNLLRIRYGDNRAVKANSTPSVYPFRILFYLLLNKYEFISAKDFDTWIPFIKNKADLDRDNFKRHTTDKYDKFRNWVIVSLEKINILVRTKDGWKIDNTKYPITKILNESKIIDANSLFFDYELTKQAIEHGRIGFTEEIKNQIKNMYDWTCWNKCPNKLVVSNSTNKPILFVHHIIPYELKSLFPKLDINTKENLIPLCWFCHTTIHFASESEKMEIVTKIWEKKQSFLSKYLASKDELMSIYMRESK